MRENFTTSPNGSLPRGAVYSLYQSYCELHSVKVLNAATFGKIIHSVFPDIKVLNRILYHVDRYLSNFIYRHEDLEHVGKVNIIIMVLKLKLIVILLT